jgi:hypothetical protein
VPDLGHRKPDTERYPRQALGVCDWPAAEAKLRALNATAKDQTVHGPSLAHRIERYLDARDGVKPKTFAQYKLLLGRLKDFAHGKNKFFIRELTVDLLEDFKTYALAGLAGTSKGTSIAKLSHFLRQAYRCGWITEALVEKMRCHKAVYEQKQPYTEKGSRPFSMPPGRSTAARPFIRNQQPPSGCRSS